MAANGALPMSAIQFAGEACSCARGGIKGYGPVTGFPRYSWLDSVPFLSGCPESWAEIGKFRITLNLIRLRPA